MNTGSVVVLRADKSGLRVLRLPAGPGWTGHLAGSPLTITFSWPDQWDQLYNF